MHTKGPWKVGITILASDSFCDPKTEITEIVEEDDRFVACTPALDEKGQDNARLIAAAPELLEIVERMIEWDGSWDEGDLPSWRIDAEALIQKIKAEGR